MEELFPQLPSQNIPDYDISFMERKSDTEASKRLNSRGKLILTGSSKCGKTRLALEFASNLLNDGYTILLLRPHAWLDVPIEIPQVLNRRRLLVFIDGLEQYVTPNPASKSSKERPFITRLTSVLEQIENFVGEPDKLWFIGTASLKAQEFADIDNEKSSWNSIPIIKLYSLSKDETFEFISRLAKQINLEISPEIAKSLAEKNDGSFYTLISAFRQWQTYGLKTIQATQINDFAGSLNELWERKYYQSTKKLPNTAYIYASLDILSLAELPTDEGLVRYLSIGLQKPSFVPFFEFVFYQAAEMHPHSSNAKNYLGLANFILKLIISIPGWLFFILSLRDTEKALRTYL
jgi:hypothetical protein